MNKLTRKKPKEEVKKKTQEEIFTEIKDILKEIKEK